MKSILLVSVMMAAQVAFAQTGSNMDELNQRIQEVNALTQARFDFVQAQLEEVAVLVASEVTGSQSVSVESTDATEISRAAGFEYYRQASASQDFAVKMLNGDICRMTLENVAAPNFSDRKVNVSGLVGITHLQCVNLLGLQFAQVYRYTEANGGIPYSKSYRISVATADGYWEAFSATVGSYDKNSYNLKMEKMEKIAQ